MKNLLSFASVFFLFIWSVGHFWYHEGFFIHIFLAAAIVTGAARFRLGGMIVLR